MAYETDVLIIGAGPTGSTTRPCARELRRALSHRVAWQLVADSPRAHITNQRANEVFRDLGISDDVARYASPWETDGRHDFHHQPGWARTHSHADVGDWRRPARGLLRASPCGMVDIIQPLLEPILFQKAAEKGATFAFNTEYVRS